MTPIIVAVVSAILAATFAVIKTKRETIWLERYRMLNELIESLWLITERFSGASCERACISIRFKVEDEQIDKRFGEEMIRLRKNKDRISIFLNRHLSEYFALKIADIERTIFDLLNVDEPDAEVERIRLQEQLERDGDELLNSIIIVQQSISVKFFPGFIYSNYRGLVKAAKEANLLNRIKKSA